ncbi:MAG: iron transporter [Gammaproteobacteria bacterium]|nr:MAG: iron transporter [Gammaproteobacteria bacterium]
MMLSLLLIFISFIALSLTLKRHYAIIFPRRKMLSNAVYQLIRLAGFSGLLIAAYLCTLSYGVSVGLVYWTGLLTVAAVTQSLLLTYKPRWLLPSLLLSNLMMMFIGIVLQGTHL